MAADIKQPIIRGIQAVGSVEILYRYENITGANAANAAASEWTLPVPSSFKLKQGTENITKIVRSSFLKVAGFRLDSEFLRANPQIASSFVIPILGGGGVAITNNNRTGNLNLVCTKVSTPTAGTSSSDAFRMKPDWIDSQDTDVYDLVTIAQIQQGQESGDSYGATILIGFNFCGETTVVEFDGCTIATVDPLGLAGNDAVNYAVSINFLNWKVGYNQQGVAPLV